MVVIWKAQSQYLCLFSPRSAYIPAIRRAVRRFHYRKRTLCFSKTTTFSTEWKTANTKRENESTLAGAVSFCHSDCRDELISQYRKLTKLETGCISHSLSTTGFYSLFFFYYLGCSFSLFLCTLLSFLPQKCTCHKSSKPVRFWHARGNGME